MKKELNMSKFLTILAFSTIIIGVSLQSVALSISVQSSGDVSALGFTLNGKNYGGAGTSYSKSGLPSGSYSFGVRVNGLFGNDVPCLYKGKSTVALSKDTAAFLKYSGNNCSVSIN